MASKSMAPSPRSADGFELLEPLAQLVGGAGGIWIGGGSPPVRRRP